MQLVGLIREYFLNRVDKLANHAPWGKPCPIEVNNDLQDVLLAHLGKKSHNVKHLPSNSPPKLCAVDRVGTYTPTPDGLTRWLCVDCDGKGHSAALDDPLGVAESIIDKLAKWNLPAHLERSGGGRGFHVWMFVDGLVEARTVRRLAFEVIPPAKLIDGGDADVTRNRGIEVFPKTDDAVGEGFGSMVWLPWWAGASQDCGEFYRTIDGRWTSYLPTDFARAKLQRVKSVAESLQAAEKNEKTRSATLNGSSGWSEWRRDTLQRLDLATVYGKWLTGKPAGKGWLKCRDPESPSGDRSPSAAVADSARNAERGSFHSFRDDRTVSVFDFLMTHGGCSDEMSAFRYLAELTQTPMPPPKGAAKKEAQQQPPAPSEKKDQIVINGRQMSDIVRDSWEALRKAEKPKLYVKSNELVRILRSAGGARMHVLTKDAAFGALIRATRWVKVKEGEHGTYYVDDKPPHEVAADVLAYPHPSIPRLASIVQAPVFDYDGRLITRGGFDEAAGIFHDKQIDIAEVPEAPHDDDVLSARMLISDDLFVDFPFCSRADYAAALGALLLPFVRAMISSSTPIHLIEAPTAGSGKGLIADLICIIFTGRPADVMTLPQDDEESRKRITAVLRLGKPIVSFDNLPYGSKSATLAAALTAHTWADRVLGKTEIVEIDNRATWLITVNNPDFNVDLARRCVRIRIDPGEARPWERQNFKHPIREWTTDHRADLVHAILTLVQYWVSKGMPRAKRTLGSFDHWSRIIGGILDTIGVPGFLENTSELYDQADTDSAEWLEFVRHWWGRHENTGVTASLLISMATDCSLVPSVRGDRGSSSQRIRLGKALARMRGRVIGHWKIDRDFDSKTKAQMYQLTPVNEEGKEPIHISNN